jgi:hypothetical protein
MLARGHQNPVIEFEVFVYFFFFDYTVFLRVLKVYFIFAIKLSIILPKQEQLLFLLNLLNRELHRSAVPSDGEATEGLLEGTLHGASPFVVVTTCLRSCNEVFKYLRICILECT